MELTGVTKLLVDNILMPILMVIGSAVLVVVKSYVKRITDSMIAKNEISSLSNITTIKNNLLCEIGTIVQAAVCTNMSLAESLKSAGGTNKLTDTDIAMLQDSTKQLVYQALPTSLTEENGSLLKIVGGKDKLDLIINNQLEHAVISTKSKMGVFNK